MFNLFNVDESEEKAYPLNIHLEYKLFEAASTPDLLQGVLYILPIYYRKNYLSDTFVQDLILVFFHKLLDYFKPSSM